MKKIIMLAMIIGGLTFGVEQLVNHAYAENSQVAAGDYHTIALQDDGTVIAVGSNVYGQTDMSSWTDIALVAAGSFHTVGVRQNGRVLAIGMDSSNQTSVSSWTGIIQVAAGLSHTVGLKSNGTVVAVGANDSGQTNVTSWTGIDQVAAGRTHTVGVKTNGAVVAVGSNTSGQLNVASWSDIIQVAAGKSFTLGLKENGTVVGAGSNDKGQLNVTAWTDIIQIVAKDSHAIGLRANGTVVSAGSNLYNQRDVSSWTDIKEVATGRYHTVGLKNDGTVVAVGSNSGGQTDVDLLNPGIKTYYLDSDGDGYGDPEHPIESLSQPAGYVEDATDCNDTDDTIHPGADEIRWDGIDQDCNGQDLWEFNTFYYDGDLDGYGGKDYSYQGIMDEPPYGYSLTNNDCVDTDDTIHPGADDEPGDGIDQDCSGSDAAVLFIYYADTDDDGFGDPTASVEAETQPEGYVDNNLDCNDMDDTINPEAVEIAGNTIDENCDGITQELNVFYKDDDGDEYGDPENFVESRTQPDGYVANGLDCDDDNADINPGMDEICNGVDDNCDDTVDEGCCDSAPDIVTPISPAGSIVGTNPVFRWEESACASEYKIIVFDSSNSAVARFTVEVEDNDSEIPDAVCTKGKCAYTLDTELDIDSYQWWIMGINYLGKGEWSSQDQGLAFDVPGEKSPAFKPMLQDPVINTGSPSTTKILFKWNDVGNASWYRLRIQDAEGEEKIPDPDDKWFEALETCTLGDCNLTVTFSNDDLSAGKYQWDVKAWNDFGSQWSDAGSFIISQ